jgi:hypothetical protein
VQIRMRATPKSLTPNKDIQALIRLAYEQDWSVVKMGNGHLRWFPPKGPFIHSACTPGSGAIKKIKGDLKRAGLILPHMEFWVDNDKEAEVKSEDDDPSDSAGERAQKLMADIPPAPPHQGPPSKVEMRRKGVIEAIRRQFEDSPSTKLSVPLLVERLQGDFPGIQAKDLYGHLSALNNRGYVRSVPGARGMYEMIPKDTAAPAGPKFVAHAIVDSPKPNGQAQDGDTLDEDNEFLERFMAFMMEMESWIRRQQKRSMAYNKLKKMLNGMDIDE